MTSNTAGTGAIDPGLAEDLDGITVIRGGGAERGWNGIRYMQGLSAKNVGSANLSINVATVPPGAIAYAHIHDGFVEKDGWGAHSSRPSSISRSIVGHAETGPSSAAIRAVIGGNGCAGRMTIPTAVVSMVTSASGAYPARQGTRGAR